MVEISAKFSDTEGLPSDRDLPLINTRKKIPEKKPEKFQEKKTRKKIPGKNPEKNVRYTPIDAVARPVSIRGGRSTRPCWRGRATKGRPFGPMVENGIMMSFSHLTSHPGGVDTNPPVGLGDVVQEVEGAWDWGKDEDGDVRARHGPQP